MGGEWASGAALVSETWPDEHRGKALGFMQSSWAIGYVPRGARQLARAGRVGLDWRAVFFVGVLPALFTLWIRRSVEEPQMWPPRTRRRAAGLARASAARCSAVTVALALMNACTLFGWWGFNTLGAVVPAAPRAEPAASACRNATMCGFVIVMQHRHVARLRDVRLHQRRRRPQATLCHVPALRRGACVLALHVDDAIRWSCCVLGPIVAFFATGYFSGFGAVTAELYPTAVRATAQGFTYNIGRVASAFAPAIAGSVAKAHGYPAALALSAGAFLAAACFWIFIPETKGRTIE